MIEYGKQTDISDIKKIWQDIFPDGGSGFNHYYFKNVFVPENCLLLKENNNIISMLCEMPYYIKGIGKAAYIYGVATVPQYRGMGFMNKLMKTSYEGLSAKNIPSFLIPENKSLFDYYAKKGYHTAFYISKKQYILKEDEAVSPMEVDIEDINNIYEQNLENVPHPIRDEKYWQIQQDMCRSTGDKLLYFKNTGYCFVCMDNKPFIQEIFCKNKNDINKLCAYVCRMLNTDNIDYITFDCNDKDIIPFGMIKGSECTLGYINMMYN